jgi:hypothetical protein
MALEQPPLQRRQPEAVDPTATSELRGGKTVRAARGLFGLDLFLTNPLVDGLRRDAELRSDVGHAQELVGAATTLENLVAPLLRRT